MKATTGIVAVMVAGMLVMGCDNPFRGDGESTPEEDAAAIGVYTQTVNQSSADSSEDTTVSVNPTVTGNNNTIIVVVGGDENTSTSDNIRTPPAEPEAEAVAEEP
jgi:hypothetical protein